MTRVVTFPDPQWMRQPADRVGLDADRLEAAGDQLAATGIACSARWSVLNPGVYRSQAEEGAHWLREVVDAVRDG